MLILCYLVPKTRASREDIAKVLSRLLISLVLVVLFSLLQIIVPIDLAAEVATTLYYMAMSWACLFLLGFTLRYTGHDITTPKLKWTFYGLAIIDNIATALNLVFHHMFTISEATYKGESFVSVQNRWGFTIHALFLYAMILGSICLLVRRLMTVSREYAMKYSSVLTALVFVVLWNFFFTFMHTTVINNSVFGYCIMGLMIYYFAIVFVPNSLQEHILSKLVDELEEGVVFIDPEGKCIYANESAERLLRVAGMETEEKDAAIHAWLKDLRIDLKEDIIAIRSVKMEDTDRHLEIEHQRMYDHRSDYIGSLIRLIDHTKDINELNDQRHRATHDSLTGLLNRDGFYEAVAAALEANPHIRHMMVCFNFKDFKYVNSFFGMSKGDEMLISAAEEIRSHLQEGDILGRLYADNYALLTRKDNFDEWKYRDYIRLFARRIVENTYTVFIHMGVYEISDPTMDVSVMCDYANLAIDTVRNDSSNRIAYYNTHMMDRVMQEKEIISEFDEALRNKDITIYLQPQVTKDGTLVGSEALVRWKHPVKGMISPGTFIPVLEENGIIYRLDRYVWEQAAQLLKSWKGTDKENLYISVNISAKDIYYMDVQETFLEFKEKYDIDPAKMKLEITETAIMYDVDRYINLVRELHEHGFEVEMDDFGNGYSSLSMLKDIEIDILKIDMAFLQEAETKKRGEVILRNVITMAKDLGVPVITEGVETEEQVALLTELGSDMFQGYYFARPMPVSDFEAKYFPAAEEDAAGTNNLKEDAAGAEQGERDKAG